MPTNYKRISLLIITLFIGICIRFILFYIFDLNPSLYSFISDRVEISTPICSWKSFVEGIYLKKHSISPYSNDIFHSSPILLHIFDKLMDKPLIIKFIFILFDIITSINLYFIGYSSQKYFLSNNNNNNFKKPSLSILSSPYFCLIIYLFYWLNPFIILITCCKSISNISHMFISLSISCSIYGLITCSSIILAIATIIDIYPFLLLPIQITMILNNLKKNKYKKNNKILCITLYIITYIITIIYLFGFNFKYNDLNWNFIEKYYLFMFIGKDITPNIGSWWYLKMSLFNRFQTFFIIILNLQPLVFVFPFLWRFRSFPYFCYYLIIHLFQIFRVYPCLSDTIFGITFLFISLFIIYDNFKHSLILIITYFIGLQLMFFMWYMWIEGGTGNANFYYAGNLLYCATNLYTICISISSARRYLNHNDDDKGKGNNNNIKQ